MNYFIYISHHTGNYLPYSFRKLCCLWFSIIALHIPTVQIFTSLGHAFKRVYVHNLRDLRQVKKYCPKCLLTLSLVTWTLLPLRRRRQEELLVSYDPAKMYIFAKNYISNCSFKTMQWDFLRLTPCVWPLIPRNIPPWLIISEPVISAIPLQCSSNWAVKPTGSCSHSKFIYQ